MGWLVAGGLIGLALVLRVAYVLATRHSYHPIDDALAFDTIATSLAHGHGFGRALVPPATGPTAYRGPLYPMALGGWYAAFGHSWTGGRIEEAIFGTVAVALIGVVAAQLFSRRVAAIAMAVAAVYPTLILYGTSLQLEPLLMCLSLASVAAALQHRRAPRSWVWPVTSGLLVGLALLTRELGLVLIPAVVWLLWPAVDTPVRTRWTARTLAAPAAAVVTIVLVLAPWTIRNEVRLHTFAPTSTSTGFTLAGTYNPTSAANKQFPTIWIPAYQDPGLARLLLSRPHPSEAWVNHVLEKATVDYIKAHPTYPFRAALWNTVGLFDLEGPRVALFIAQYIPYSAKMVRLSVYSSYLVDVLALIALFIPLTRRAPKAVWSIPILAFVAIAFVSGNIRYRASIEPYLVLLAAVTITTGLERTRWIHDRRPAPAAS